jgi:hypothetical protein
VVAVGYSGRMAPPILLSNVAGTLALSFTAGRAAPTSEPPSVQQPTSVPTPPRLPAVPGEETTSGETTTAQPDPTAGVTTEPATSATTEPAMPEPPSQAEPVRPVGPIEAGVEDGALDEIDAPSEAEPSKVPISAPRLLRPNQRKLMFSLFVGGSKALRGGYSYGGGMDFQAEAAFGGFNDRFRVGGFGVVQVTSGFPLQSFTFAPRLTLNRQIVPDHAIYLTTNVTLGYRLTRYSYGYAGGSYVYEGDGYDPYDYEYYDYGPALYHGGVLGVSWGATAIIAERLVLSFRPLDVELVAPAQGGVQINWSVMGGLGVMLGRPDKRKRKR